MIFTELLIAGCFAIEPEYRGDDRGRFARIFCDDEFTNLGLKVRWSQMNMSQTAQSGTVRGMHFQRSPMAEVKVVRCTGGAVWDVVIDLRQGSKSFGKWTALELTATAGTLIYIPEGCAHGFQALTDNAELTYMHSIPHSPDNEGGVCATDPDLKIDWPVPVRNLSPRDTALPKLSEVEPLI